MAELRVDLAPPSAAGERDWKFTVVVEVLPVSGDGAPYVQAEVEIPGAGAVSWADWADFACGDRSHLYVPPGGVLLSGDAPGFIDVRAGAGAEVAHTAPTRLRLGAPEFLHAVSNALAMATGAGYAFANDPADTEE